MAKDEKKGSKLGRAFKWAAKATLSVAFGFAVLGALDFTLFHELAEGQFFMDSIKPLATDVLRADIPILGASVADMFVGLGKLAGGAGGVEVLANASEFSNQMGATTSALSNNGYF